jgi:tetratricopeptide (TPR) repeat protein
MKKHLLLILTLTFTATAFANNNISKDSADFYLKKAQVLKETRKIWDADKSFQKAISFAPTDENVRIEYGNYLVEQRKYFAAVEQYAKILEKDLKNKNALQKLTEVSYTLHRWSDVVMYANKLGADTKIHKLNFMLGKSYYELENYGQAQKYLTMEVDSNPTSFEAVSLLGRVHIDLNNYKHAIAIYNKALNLDPNNNQMIYELGLLYYTINNEKEAIKYFELAIEKGYKKDLGVMENLGLAYLSFDLAKGIDILEKVLEMKPGNGAILFQVAQAYYKAEKFEDAALSYRKIYDADPSNVRSLYMSGLAYIKKGDKNKGTNICNLAISLDPSLAQLRTQKLSF